MHTWIRMHTIPLELTRNGTPNPKWWGHHLWWVTTQSKNSFVHGLLGSTTLSSSSSALHPNMCQYCVRNIYMQHGHFTEEVETVEVHYITSIICSVRLGQWNWPFKVWWGVRDCYATLRLIVDCWLLIASKLKGTPRALSVAASVLYSIYSIYFIGSVFDLIWLSSTPIQA